MNSELSYDVLSYDLDVSLIRRVRSSSVPTLSLYFLLQRQRMTTTPMTMAIFQKVRFSEKNANLALNLQSSLSFEANPDLPKNSHAKAMNSKNFPFYLWKQSYSSDLTCGNTCMCCRNHKGSSHDGSTLDAHELKMAKEDSVVNNLLTIRCCK